VAKLIGGRSSRLTAGGGWLVRGLLLAVLLAGSWVAGASGDAPSPRQRLFAGKAFEGLPLTSSLRSAVAFSYIYGSCDASGGDGGCAPPLELQNWSICRRHPLEIDRIPLRISRMRGVPVIDYGDALEVLTGRTDVVVFADAGRARRVVAALRPARGPARLGRLLAAPRLPRWVLRELKLVRELRAGGASRRALRRRLGISVSAIRVREQLAAAIGKRALRGVPAARVSPGDVIGDRQALITVQELSAREATPDERRRAARHRKRLKTC
jgi:hypothetical protein